MATDGTPKQPDPTLHLPRLLCLHGGGVTAEIFRLQARALIKALPTLRLVFADGPFYCAAGPGIVPVYETMGPFRRWLRWLPDEHPPIDDASATEEVLYSIETTKREDAGTGEWVGVLGFSQGAKVSASLLYEQQVQEELYNSGKGEAPETGYRFAVLLAGRHPLVSFTEKTRHPGLVNSGEVSEGFDYDEGKGNPKLRLPSVHVHGTQDPGLELHRRMLRQYCEEESASVVEWEGGHRVPIKKVDVDRIVAEIYRVARETGVEC